MAYNMGNKNGVHGDRFDFIGESTEAKPTGCADYSFFLEADTNLLYYFKNGVWREVGYNA